MAGQHPFFGQKLKLFKKAIKVSYFLQITRKTFFDFPGKNSILGILHRVAYDLERLFKNFSDILGQPEGHTHFFATIEIN